MLYKLLFMTLLLGSCIHKTTGEELLAEKELILSWSYEYTSETVSLSLVSGEPAIVDKERVLIFPDGNLTMINANTGGEEWLYKLPQKKPIISNTVIFDKTQLYIKHENTSNGIILELTSGVEVHNLTLNSGLFSDFINDDCSHDEVYLIGRSKNVFVFTKHGVFLRELIFDHKITSVTYYKGSLLTTHSYRNGTKQGTRGELASYNLSTNTFNWRYETDSGSYLYTSILLEDDTIYAGTTSGPSEFVAINANTGEVLWRTLDLDSWAYTLGEKSIYINEGADLVALDKKTGRQMWRTKFPGGGYDSSNVAYMDGFVYHSHSGSFFVLDAQTGEIVYSTVLPDRSYAGNVSAGFGKVFVQSDYHLYAYKGWGAK